ncbi:MAG: hypothetical protein BWY82_01294 [Verrucomicrobia bacterium ADurb.Bin474]|nr:MAG: hypothetical protein BWY82_01294 [Verrucomicrobia bacterium ADurb.Bin474]
MIDLLSLWRARVSLPKRSREAACAGLIGKQDAGKTLIGITGFHLRSISSEDHSYCAMIALIIQFSDGSDAFRKDDLISDMIACTDHPVSDRGDRLAVYCIRHNNWIDTQAASGYCD